MLKSVISTVMVLLLCTHCSKGQFTYFNLTFDSGLSVQQNEGVWGSSLFEFDDGYLFISFTKHNPTSVTGSWLVRIDLDGDTLWTVKAIDPRYAEFPQNMIAASNGRYAFVSTISDLVSQTQANLSLTLIDEEGHQIWKVLYGNDSLAEVAAQVILTSDGGFAMIGQRTIDSQSDADMYLVRADSGGNFLWEQQYGGGNFEGGYSLVQTPDSGFLLLGWTRSFGAGQRDFYLVKTDSLGVQQWQRTYGGGGDEVGFSIMLLSDGNYLLTGAGSQGSAGSIGRKYKVTPEGGVIWSKTYAYPSNSGNNLRRTVELPNGDLASAGLTDRIGNNNSGWLLRTDSQGNVLWQREYDYNSNTDLFYTLIATSDGGFLLGGQAIVPENASQDAWLLKVDSVGCTYADCLVGIDENEPTKVVADVWPNPASSFINIEWQKQAKAEVRMFDMTGKEVLRRQSHEQREVVDVSLLPNGLYLLQLVQEDVKAVLRIVVQH